MVKVVRAFRPDVILTLPLESAGRRAAPPGRGAAGSRGLPGGGGPRALSRADRRGASSLAGAQAVPGRRGRRRGTGARAAAGHDHDRYLRSAPGHDVARAGQPGARVAPLAGRGPAQGRARSGGKPRYFLVDSEAARRAEPRRTYSTESTGPCSASSASRGREAAWLRTALAALQVRAGTLQANFDARAPQASAAALAAFVGAVRSLRSQAEGGALTGRRARRAGLPARGRGARRPGRAGAGPRPGLRGRGRRRRRRARPDLRRQGHRLERGRRPAPGRRRRARRPRRMDGGDGPRRDRGRGAAAGGLDSFDGPRPGGRAFLAALLAKEPAHATALDLVRPEHDTLPWSPPDVVARLRYTSHGVAATLDVPAVWRYEGRAGGEKRKVVNVVPALSVRVVPAVTRGPAWRAGDPPRAEGRGAEPPQGAGRGRRSGSRRRRAGP